MPARIFISYAREDEKTAYALADHLGQLKSLGIAETWIDRDIGLGESWEGAINDQTGEADVVLVLVSSAYLAPGFAHDKELGLLEEAGERGARVIPVIVGDCAWEAHPYLSSLQAFARGETLKAPTTITFQRQAGRLVEELRMSLTTEAMQKASEPGTDEAVPSSVGSSPPGRTDPSGLALKGSQLQTQLYVNARPDELNQAIIEAVETLPSDAEIEWRSPLRKQGYAEFRDAEFLAAMDLEGHASALKSLWPARGPRWDALAVVRSPSLRDGSGVILAEGKSYPDEMNSTTRAKDRSRDRIASAIASTQEALDIQVDPERWLTEHYQLANRLAHVVWLREQGVAAWLLLLLFVDDPHRPTTAEQWTEAIKGAKRDLGLTDPSILAEIQLMALDRSLLAA